MNKLKTGRYKKIQLRNSNKRFPKTEQKQLPGPASELMLTFPTVTLLYR